MSEEMPHERLFRPETRGALRLIRRRWKTLSYPRFVVQAEREMNPERTLEPEDNFTIWESVAEWIRPIPIRLREDDIRTYIDGYGRPDSYATAYCNGRRREWNENIANYPVQIYRVYYDYTKIIPATKRRKERREPVTWDWLQTLRGRDSVRQVDTMFVNMIDGLEERRQAIQSCENARTVDQRIDEVLRENEAIERRGGE